MDAAIRASRMAKLLFELKDLMFGLPFEDYPNDKAMQAQFVQSLRGICLTEDFTSAAVVRSPRHAIDLINTLWAEVLGAESAEREETEAFIAAIDAAAAVLLGTSEIEPELPPAETMLDRLPPYLLDAIDLNLLNPAIAAWADRSPGTGKESKYSLLARLMESAGLKPPLPKTIERYTMDLRKRRRGPKRSRK